MDTVLVLRGGSRDPTGEAGAGVRVRGRGLGGGERLPQIEVEQVDQGERAELMRDPEVTEVSLVMPTKLIAPWEAQAPAGEVGATWGVDAVGAVDSRYTGQGVSVALLDTGIDRSHPAFDGVTLAARDFSGQGLEDVQGHGTHCAGTIVGRRVGGLRIGVAPGVSRLLSGKIFGGNGSGSTEMLLRGALWALAEGAQVISLSLGIDFPGMVRQLAGAGWPLELATSRALGAYGDTLRMLEKAIAMMQGPSALGDGAVVLAAAGNESRRDASPSYALGPALPAAAEGAISVGAVTRDGSRFGIGPFSNAPQVCAPGVGITSSCPSGGLTAMSGTSMACPHVAGVAALWWEALRGQGSPASAGMVAAKLLATCRPDVFSRGLSTADFGAGLVASP